MSTGSFHPSGPHQNTFVTFLTSFSCASHPESWQQFLHFKIRWGQGRAEGEKRLEITSSTRILYLTCPLHPFSHPGEWKGLCSKPQAEIKSEAGSEIHSAWNRNLFCCRKCLRKSRGLSFNSRLTLTTEA